ncbi:MAG TPA: MFS transporter, partial [Polyangiaceae bacterium]|nr:MFS transporter [Polyangiaceae bacterium]
RAFSPASLLSFALACSSIRWAAVALAREPAILLLLQPLHAVSWCLGWLASLGYASRRFPEHSLATAQGLFTTAVGAGSVVGMVTWGPVYQHAGGAAVFGGASCFSACACAFAVALERKWRLRVADTATGE